MEVGMVLYAIRVRKLMIALIDCGDHCRRRDLRFAYPADVYGDGRRFCSRSHRRRRDRRTH